MLEAERFSIAGTFFMTHSQVAQRFGVTRESVWRWVKQGKLRGERIGRDTLILRSEVDKYYELWMRTPRTGRPTLRDREGG